jgi:hypothetical protein
MQRASKWWLPYMILEFDRSQMLVEAIDGDLGNPVYNYRTPLCVILVILSLACSLVRSDVFGPANVIGSVYLRTQEPIDKHQSMSQMDILIARIEFSPSLDGFVSPPSLRRKLRPNLLHRASPSNGTSPSSARVRSTWTCSSSRRGRRTRSASTRSSC